MSIRPMLALRSGAGRVPAARTISLARSTPLISRATPASTSRTLLTSSTTGNGNGGSRQRRRFALPLTAGLLAVPTTLALLPTLAADADEVKLGDKPKDSLQSATTGALLRSYLVYSIISLPYLVDYSPTILHALTHSPIPFLKEITESIVRYTFFYQFAAGETVKGCVPLMEEQRKRFIGSMLNYSAEAELDPNADAGEDLEEKARSDRFDEVMRALEEAGEYERTLKQDERGATYFALKVTGLIDFGVLQRASYTLLRLRPLTQSTIPTDPTVMAPVPYPGTPLSIDAKVVAREMKDEHDGQELLALTGMLEDFGVLETDEGLRKGDLEELSKLWGRLKVIGNKAKENGIPLLLDAEYTWVQPALDAYTLLLSEVFNKPPSKGDNSPWYGPLIYGTYQSYLTRQPTHLAHAIKHAEDHGYALGVKLVRGAYFGYERQKWVKEGRAGADPIWMDKRTTDNAYNGSVEKIVSTLSKQLSGPRPDLALSVIFGTHNPQSCELLCDELKKAGLAEPVGDRLKLRDEVVGKIGVAQLLGMKDDLTDSMAARFVYGGKPVAIKYMAYGKLSEVMPYLGRRAIENKSIMSGDDGAAAEKRRLSAELKKRMFG